jgi:hypothetical protein
VMSNNAIGANHLKILEVPNGVICLSRSCVILVSPCRLARYYCVKRYNFEWLLRWAVEFAAIYR